MTPATLLSLMEQRARDIARTIAIPGPDGADGEDGADGRNGRDGRDGVDGRDGAPGKHGVDGRDGVDAVSPNIPGPSETVQAATTFGQKPVAGRSDLWSRGDHDHGTPERPATRSVMVGGGAGEAHPNLSAHQTLGLATASALDAHAATDHGGPQKLYIQDTQPTAPGLWLWLDTATETLWWNEGAVG